MKISQNTAHFRRRRTKGAAATTGTTVCSQMGGSYSSKTASNGKTVESCVVESGGGPVVGYWVDGKWQGAH
jgi:putative hemolysin